MLNLLLQQARLREMDEPFTLRMVMPVIRSPLNLSLLYPGTEHYITAICPGVKPPYTSQPLRC
jgi:hypothetical protein